MVRAMLPLLGAALVLYAAADSPGLQDTSALVQSKLQIVSAHGSEGSAKPPRRARSGTTGSKQPGFEDFEGGLLDAPSSSNEVEPHNAGSSNPMDILGGVLGALGGPSPGGAKKSGGGMPSNPMEMVNAIMGGKLDQQVAGKLIESAIKMAVGRKKNNGTVVPRGPPAKPVPQTAEEKKREPETRSALRNNVMWVLRQMPSIPAVARGAIVSEFVNEVMAIRRTTHPKVRGFIDAVANQDLSDVSMANLHVKFKDFAQALASTGLQSAGRTLDVVSPFIKLCSYMDESTLSSWDLHVSANLLRDLIVFVPKENSKAIHFMSDMAVIMDANAGNNKTAGELITELNMTDNTTNSSALNYEIIAGDAIFTARDLKANFSEENVFRGVSQLLLDAHLEPVGRFMGDFEPMVFAPLRKGRLTVALKRVAQLVEELNILNVSQGVAAYKVMDNLPGKAIDRVHTRNQDFLKMFDQTETSVDKALTVASDWLKAFVPNASKTGDVFLHNASREFDKYATLARKQFKVLSSEALVKLGEMADNTSVGMDVVSKNLTTELGHFNSFIDVGVQKLAVLVDSAADIFMKVMKFFACTLQVTRDAMPECKTVPDEEKIMNLIMQGPVGEVVNFIKSSTKKAHKGDDTTIELTKSRAADKEKAEEEAGEQLAARLLQLRGDPEDEGESNDQGVSEEVA